MVLLETLSFACLYLYCTHQVATTIKSPRVPSRHFKLTGPKPHDLWGVVYSWKTLLWFPAMMMMMIFNENAK